MGFFESYFPDSDGDTERAVCCPFPHHTSTGIAYKETNPSAHINTDARLFHCKACGSGMNEVTFISKVLNCSFGDAVRLSKIFDYTEDVEKWEASVTLDELGYELLNTLKISPKVALELKLTNIENISLIFPVFLYDKVIDMRIYSPGKSPKVKSRKGAITGALIPQETKDDDINKNKVIYMCAGEKDMATSRSHGLNAYTLTGGELSLPFSYNFFVGKKVVILYDNDDAGRRGANRLASNLLPYCEWVKIVDQFHSVCKEDKEDMTDYWNKYNGTKAQITKWAKEAPIYTKQELEEDQQIPFVTLAEATTPKLINKIVQSNIQVIGVADIQYVVPTHILGIKNKDNSGDATMAHGTVVEWFLTEETVHLVPHLADGSFTETDINKNIKQYLLKIPLKERSVTIMKKETEIMYKGTVTDMIESARVDTMPMEYTAYSIGTRLESGKKYKCTYKLIPHPYKGQHLIMLIMKAVPAEDTIANFKVTEEIKGLLMPFNEVEGTVAERVFTMTQKVKGLLGYNGNNTLIEVIDLSFHTVLEFNLGQFRNIRGYLDTLVVGESRVGKSSTAETLRNCYNIGTFTSLAGNSATIPGLVGGSNKIGNGAMQTKAGLIPQNHKGLIIFEEFGKCRNDIIAELTDVRSSNEVRITRVSGTMTLPAMVRMISLTNVKNTGNEIKSIASYPNGIAIVTELVPTAEDIARYDILCVLSDRGTSQVDPYWQPEKPFTNEQYRARIRWVWSRTPEQIIISPEVGARIIGISNALNEQYECHIKLFGTEAWKKITRLAISIAGYLVSTDESFENIIVKKEHVNYAADLLVRLYDNSTFRLKEYVNTERKYNKINTAGISLLQDLYTKNASLLIMLEQEARPSRNSLMAAVGLDNNEYNGYISQLTKGSFVKLAGSEVIPTERFRLGMAKINRETSLKAIGENNA